MSISCNTAPRLSDAEFCFWVGEALPGDTLEYHRGFIAVDVGSGNLSTPEQKALIQELRTAMRGEPLSLAMLISGILEDEGHITRTARDADEALKAIEERRPHLIVLDIWLQGSRLDGLEVLSQIKSHDDNAATLDRILSVVPPAAANEGNR